MTNEEFNRKAEFLLNQQAKADADMAELKKAQKQTEQSLDRATKNISHLAGFIHEGFGLVMNIFKETDAKIEAIADAHARTEAALESLAESQKLTEQQLQSLTIKLDRHISEGHRDAET